MAEAVATSEHNRRGDPELLFEQEGSDYHLKLRLKNHQLECRADLEFRQPPEQISVGEVCTTEELTPAALLRILAQHGVSRTIDFEAFYLFCAAAVERRAQRDVVLARGCPPVRGEDGRFEMVVKGQGSAPEFQEDEKGNVDLRTLHSYTEISPDQKLGMVHPPGAGVPGLTANGLPIPAEAGNPFKLTVGEGVALKYDGRVAVATRAGRALLDRQTLSVVDALLVPGDLDLKIGNIDFHGFVEIKGDVPDDFSVKASKGLKIGGSVGACRIEAGGSIEIGSVAGHDSGQIVCHGDLKANFLNQVQVTCYGNVQVVNEIRNSQVKATGRILVERGSIIGGKCLALEGIEANVLGATSGIRTHLVAGRYFPDTDRFDYLRQRQQEIEKQLQVIRTALGPLTQARHLGATLEHASELRLDILNRQWEKLEQEKGEVSAELASSAPQVFRNANPKVNALKTIHEGVVVCLGQSTEKFTIQHSGPLSLIENTHDGGLRHLGLSPLSHLAGEMERDLVDQDAE